MEEKEQISAECPRCGNVELGISDVRCAVEREGGDRGLCEYDCPQCGKIVLVPTTSKTVAEILGAGAKPVTSLPFEIFETHDGPPLTNDELIDFHQSLAETCCVPPELEKAA